MHVKEHIREHKIVYASVASGITFAGITYFIMRRYSDCSISSCYARTAKRVPDVPGESSVNALEDDRGGLVLGNNYALNNVSFFLPKDKDRQVGLFGVKKQVIFSVATFCCD